MKWMNIKIIATLLFWAGVQMGYAETLQVPNDYLGVWQAAQTNSGSSYLVIRDDGTAGGFGSSANGTPIREGELTYEVTADGLTLLEMQTPTGSRPLNQTTEKRRSWISFDAKTETLELCLQGRSTLFKRPTTHVEDPFRHIRPMKDAVVGVWQTGGGFNAYGLVLSEQGEALVALSLSLGYGTWCIVEEKRIEITIIEGTPDFFKKGTRLLFDYDTRWDRIQLDRTKWLTRKGKQTPEEELRPYKERLAKEEERKRKILHAAHWKKQASPLLTQFTTEAAAAKKAYDALPLAAQYQLQGEATDIIQKGVYETDGLALVAFLTEKSLLLNIATQSTKRAIRAAAIKKINATEDLVGLLDNTAHYDVIDEVIQRLAETTTPEGDARLASLVTNHPSQRVRFYAIQKIKDPAILLDRAKHDNSYDVRNHAVQRLSDPAHLREVIDAGKHPDAQRAALSKLQNIAPAALKEIAKTAPHWTLRCQAIETFNDEDFLFAIATSDKEDEVRKCALKKLSNPSMLITIAKQDPSEDVRKTAIYNIQDPAVLTEIAIHDPSETVGRSAFMRLADKKWLTQAILTDIAREGRHHEIRGMALMRITDPEAQKAALIKGQKKRSAP
jgi:hypothetical protein